MRARLTGDTLSVCRLCCLCSCALGERLCTREAQRVVCGAGVASAPANGPQHEGEAVCSDPWRDPVQDHRAPPDETSDRSLLLRPACPLPRVGGTCCVNKGQGGLSTGVLSLPISLLLWEDGVSGDLRGG